MGLRVLLTNLEFYSHTGTPLFLLDFARELRRQGHTPAIFTLASGRLANSLRQDGIPIIEDMCALPWRPDVIHGHHRTPTLTALAGCPGVPAIFVSHAHTSFEDGPPEHPRIRRYFGVSRLCVHRLHREGGPAAKSAELLLNFVDLRRFQPRTALPERPTRALVFSNYATERTHLPAISAACYQAGLSLDVAGADSGNLVARPEEILGRYDLVFAKAKAAMEALCVGTAVILCDFAGSGPIVTTADFDRLRAMNFGFESLRFPLAAEHVVAQIARYDPLDSASASARIRVEADLVNWTERVTAIYEKVIGEEKLAPPGPEPAAPPLFRARFMRKVAMHLSKLGPQPRAFLRRLPGHRLVRSAFLKASDN